MAGGRPSKFTAEIQEKLLKALSVGMPAEFAAQTAGISYATYRRWLKIGETKRKGALREFHRQVQEIRGITAMRWLAIIDKAAMAGDWKAAAYKLEHSHPDFFAKKAAAEGGGRVLKDGEMIVGEPGAYEALIARLRARRSESERAEGEPPQIDEGRVSDDEPEDLQDE